MKQWSVRLGDLMLLLAVVGIALAMKSWLVPREPLQAGQIIEAVQGMSSLVTLRVQVSDVQFTEIRGYTGSIRAALLVRGEVELGTDLSRAQLVDVDSVKRTATLVLPRPTLHTAKVDLAKTRLVALSKRGLWWIVPGTDAEEAVVFRAYREAEQAMAAAGRRPELEVQAERQAETTLKHFAEGQSWQIGVRWLP